MFFKNKKKSTLELPKTYVVDKMTFLLRTRFHQKGFGRLSVSSKGILLSLPLRASSVKQKSIAQELLDWFSKEVFLDPIKFSKYSLVKQDLNKEYKIFDYKYYLRVKESKKVLNVKIDGNEVLLGVPKGFNFLENTDFISQKIGQAFSKKYLKKIEKILYDLNEKYFKKKITNVSLKNMSSRWGSCSSSGRISIATQLLLAPEEILEYVCIHELAHLIEQNHSQLFWQEVARVLPNYKDLRLRLKKDGHLYQF